jgi:hypothetical protein
MRLPHVTAETRRLAVLAVGSGSMQEPEGTAQRSMGEILSERLRAALPGRDVDVHVVSRRGQTATEMLVTLRTALADGHVRLVLWQTGTVEAIRGISLQAFRATLDDGLRVIHDAGADAVLIDPQYSRRLTERVDMRPYRRVLQDAAQAAGAVLFDRYTLMRVWAESGQLDLDRTSRNDRAAALERLQACLSEALVDNVLAGMSR